MYIIQLEASENGSRSPLQTWDYDVLPDGYAFCPDEFHSIFYSGEVAGFVNITVENGVVTSMEVNQAAVDAYLASLPEVDPGAGTKVNPIEELQADNVKLKAQVQALTESTQFLEDCIVEMAETVYA